MFICTDCGCIFERPKVVTERHGLGEPPYEKLEICPECGGAFVPVKRCNYCGEVIADQFVETANGLLFCDNCYCERNIEDDL